MYFNIVCINIYNLFIALYICKTMKQKTMDFKL